jgi:hypothetical protein
MTDMSHRLIQETKAAEVLREQIKTIAGDDEDVLRDSIEGETSIHELLEKVVEQIVNDGAMADSIGAVCKKLKERQDRIEKRIAWFRTAAASAMEVAGIKKKESPYGTISLKNVPPGVVIIEEASIPAEFWKAQEPKMDKKALLEALKDGRTIPGCELGNGSISVQVRV